MSSFEETNNPGYDDAMHVPANPGQQPETYPTKSAYNQACKALWEQRARAERAEGLVLEAKQVLMILVKAKSFQEIDDAQQRASGMVGYLRRKLERPVPLQCVADHLAVECVATMVDGRPKERAIFNTMRQAEDYAVSKRLLGYKVRFDPVYRQADVGDLQRQLANALGVLRNVIENPGAESVQAAQELLCHEAYYAEE